MAAPKEAIALVLDIGASMAHGGEDGTGCLATALKAVNMIIQRKIFSKSKDELALILFGTDGTDNALHDGSEGYEHISTVRELAPADLPFLSLVNKGISQGNSEGDFIDALVVAMDHLISKTSGRKFDLRVVLFTNLASPFGMDQIDTIAKSMKDNNIQLTFVGPDLEGDDEDDEQNDDEMSDDKKKPERLQGQERKPLTEQQVQGVNCINYILGEIDGEGISLSEVLPMLSFFQMRSVKQTTVFRGPLEIGNSLKINVYGYCKIKEAKPSSWKKLSAVAEASANPQSMSISMQRSHHLQDEDQTEIEPDEVVKAYKYGKSLIPISKVDQNNLKLETEKCLSVLGFTDRANINRGHYLGDSVYMFAPQPGDQDASRALSAVVHALEEKNMAAIARYCFRKNAAPKLGILLPHIKSQFEGLVFIQMPYREDVRQYQFPSLGVTPKDTPSEEQLQAMDQLIDNMDLSTNQMSEDGEQSEAFRVRKTMNPFIQRQCQCIQHRALNPDEDRLPNVEEYIQSLLQAPTELTNRCCAINGKLKELFPLEEVDWKKSSKAAASTIFNATKSEPNGEDKPSSLAQADANFSFTAIDHGAITEVGTVDPVRDFRALIARGGSTNFEEASTGLQKRIAQLVNDSFLNQNYSKAIQCLKVLREESVKSQQSGSFNSFLMEIKTSMAGGRRNDFWQEIKAESIQLISQTECTDSTFSSEEARKFFEDFAQVVDEKENAVMEDVDDLVDLM